MSNGSVCRTATPGLLKNIIYGGENYKVLRLSWLPMKDNASRRRNVVVQNLFQVKEMYGYVCMYL